MAAAPMLLAVAMQLGGQQPLHPGAEIMSPAWQEDEMDVLRHQTIAGQPHRYAGAGLAKEPDEAVVVVGIVEDPRPAVTAMQGMVAIATY